MLGFDGEYSAGHPKAKIWCFSVKICRISAAKHFIEKSTIFSQRLYASVTEEVTNQDKDNLER